MPDAWPAFASSTAPIAASTKSNRWGEEHAARYIRNLFARFDEIASAKHPWRAVAAEFGVDGFYCRHEHHYIYWRVLSDGAVGIVTVLHERMHQLERFREDVPQ